MSLDPPAFPSMKLSRVLDIRSACNASNPLRARALLAHSVEAAGSHIAQSAACRALLGMLLHKTIGEQARDWQLVYAESGAPELLLNHQAAPIDVSLSHTGGYLMVAICKNARIGVDVERQKKRKRSSEMAAFLGWNPVDSNQMNFESRWTLWEAGAKCFERSSLNSSNPAFIELDGKLQPGKPGTYGPWHGFMDRLPGKAHYSIVLHAALTAGIAVQTSDLLQLKLWDSANAVDVQAGATIP